MKYGYNRLSDFEEMLKWLNYGVSWVKGQTMTLTSSAHKFSCSHSDHSNYHL